MDRTGRVNPLVETVAQLKGKESNPRLQLNSCNALESSSVIVCQEDDWTEPVSLLRSPEVISETFINKTVIKSVGPEALSEHLAAGPPNATGAIAELSLENGLSFSNGGCSGNQVDSYKRKCQWENFYQVADSPWDRNLPGGVVSNKMPVSGVINNMGNVFMPNFCVQSPIPIRHPDEDNALVSDHLTDVDSGIISSNKFTGGQGGIHPKDHPSSGFSHFLLKNTQKGKGIEHRHYRTQERFATPMWDQKSEKEVREAWVAAHKLQNSSVHAKVLSSCSSPGNIAFSTYYEITLREWLKPGKRKIDKVESLHLFKQILEIVDLAHSKGLSLRDIQPSYFKISSSKRVKYIGSQCPHADIQISETAVNRDSHCSDSHSKRRMDSQQVPLMNSILSEKRQRISEHANYAGWFRVLSSVHGMNHEKFVDDDTRSSSTHKACYDTRETQNSCNLNWTNCIPFRQNISNPVQLQPTSESMQSEQRWYCSPEVLNDGIYTLSSNIYSLGVLLFELFCCFESWEMHAAAMSSLHNRILHPNFLSEYPKEAGFCLWLLHPEPSCRPKASEILKSDLFSENREIGYEDKLSLSIGKEDAESELLLDFLLELKKHKHSKASRLVNDLRFLNADIEEAERRHSLRTKFVSQSYEEDSLANLSGKFTHKVPLSSLTMPHSSGYNEGRSLRNISQLGSAYFSMRSRFHLPETDAVVRSDKGVLRNQYRCSSMQNVNEDCFRNKKPDDRLGVIFEDICKYARYSQFVLRGIVRNGDLLNSSNVICSLSFDRDEEFFASAGVSKRIKIFEYNSVFNDTVDIHYPIVEMSNRSKLSCVCWNSYIKNYLASTDYDGVVQLWDASTGQAFLQYTEHQKRAWSADFSQADPTKLASGSDDCSVKLWSINQQSSINTIRNVANVCCVQFSPYSTHLLAFGSADYKTYCYDLRNARIPWCTLAGHGKAVSYVKFLDPDTIVSASTDNTLRIWDLNKTAPSGLSTGACNLTLKGHANEKNFVGLSASDGYIACGSETNEVYVYYRSLPMPITSHRFGSIDPVSGHETTDDNGQFVSTVCYRQKSNMLVAANSNGNIKLLQMV